MFLKCTSQASAGHERNAVVIHTSAWRGKEEKDGERKDSQKHYTKKEVLDKSKEEWSVYEKEGQRYESREEKKDERKATSAL